MSKEKDRKNPCGILHWQVSFADFHWAGKAKAAVRDDYETYGVGSGMPASLNPFFLSWQLSQRPQALPPGEGS
jgi:hypothetical protein